jgi:5-methylcytosine-specific restriction endonuclease McrA
MSLRRFLKRKRKKGKKNREKDLFYKSPEWKELRYEKLREVQYCECCGKVKGDELEGGEKVKLTVDHIKPRSKHPELALELSNLQVLCQSCNEGKSNIFEDSFKNVLEV